nr:YbhB/YbcL family Raf kinase inhibitor-like protein [Candidatus Freyarchaeota archaeon]
MIVRSNDFENEGKLPVKFTCDGENIFPHLEWSDVPEGTKSFAILFQSWGEPVPSHKHWLVYNIPKDVREIPQNGPVPGIEVLNDFGWLGYTGPCPSKGEQTYYFTVYALNVEKLEGVDIFTREKVGSVDRANFVTSINQVQIAYAEIALKYSK